MCAVRNYFPSPSASKTYLTPSPQKMRAWTDAKRTGDYANFKIKSKTTRAALRNYRRSGKEHLMYSKHRGAFFSYFRQITVRLCNSSPIHLCAGGYVLSDHDATDGFHRNLSSNFSVLRSHPQTTRITETAKEDAFPSLFVQLQIS